MMHIVTVGDIVGMANWVQENVASCHVDSIWLVNNHMDLNTN